MLGELSRDVRIRQYAQACATELRIRRSTTIDSFYPELKDDKVRFITDGLRQAREWSWKPWRTVLKAAYGYSLDDEELRFFRSVAQRDPPKKQVRELWLVVGRRGGKDSIASLLATTAARYADTSRLRPGEDGIVACIACTRDQAEIVWNYIKGYFDTMPELRAWLRSPNIGNQRIELKNKVEIRVATNSFRSPRGRAIICVILDEVAFYRDENSANPDIETYRALQPGMAMIPEPMLIGISSPHKQSGLLYQKYNDHFGKYSDEILVVQADTRTMNPLVDILDPGLIDNAMVDDPQLAEAEYFAKFRGDLADYVTKEALEACVKTGIYEIPPERGVRYTSFADPSGGSNDSMTLCIGHRTVDRRGVVDCLREWRAPFVPSQVVAEAAAVLKSYGITRTMGDRYAGVWPKEQFKTNGIIYEISDLKKSDIYREFLPFINSTRVDLLDHRRANTQILLLERRTIRGGRDSFDHPRGAHDDLANVIAGCMVRAIGKAPMVISDEVLAASEVRTSRSSVRSL